MNINTLNTRTMTPNERRIHFMTEEFMTRKERKEYFMHRVKDLNITHTFTRKEIDATKLINDWLRRGKPVLPFTHELITNSFSDLYTKPCK